MGDDDRQPPVREHPGFVLGIALCILVLGSLVAWICLPKGEARDGAKLFEAWFGAGALPAEFSVAEARKLMGGEEVLRLLRSNAAPEREKAPAAAKGNDTRVDWTQVEQGASDQLPLSIIFVEYPKERAKDELGRLFSEKLQPGKLDEIGTSGGRLVLEIGTLSWGERSAAFVVEREFEPGGTFRDSARINLSKADGALIASASWARSEPFSKSRLQALLGSLRRS